jgi:hypothetical protein
LPPPQGDHGHFILVIQSQQPETQSRRKQERYSAQWS